MEDYLADKERYQCTPQHSCIGLIQSCDLKKDSEIEDKYNLTVTGLGSFDHPSSCNVKWMLKQFSVRKKNDFVCGCAKAQQKVNKPLNLPNFYCVNVFFNSKYGTSHGMQCGRYCRLSPLRHYERAIIPLFTNIRPPSEETLMSLCCNHSPPLPCQCSSTELHLSPWHVVPERRQPETWECNSDVSPPDNNNKKRPAANSFTK